jgi:hypothetical protein
MGLHKRSTRSMFYRVYLVISARRDIIKALGIFVWIMIISLTIEARRMERRTLHETRGFAIEK